MPLAVLPKISIITPSFNQGPYIEQCIQSVLQQGYADFEHIIVDGGSTDETVKILEKYPHLLWVSEKDNGQADALNKGFAMSSGSIIGWLNSDDFYAPNIFSEVATNLQEYPILMGACELTDVDGVPKSRIINKERTWFDLIKYWVPYSIPTQPAIFFTKELLEMSSRADGSCVDETLNYCMDYDLWLRIAHSCPLSNRLDETLAYYRMTPDNKTSDSVSGMPYAEPEMSRIFRRHQDLAFDVSFEISVILPFSTIDILKRTLDALARQDHKNFEVLVPLLDIQSGKRSELNKLLAEWNESIRVAGYGSFARILTIPEAPSLGSICNSAVHQSEGRVITFILNPSQGSLELSLAAIALAFQNDRRGIIQNDEVFSVRKLALLEVAGFSEDVMSIAVMVQTLREKIHESGWK